MAAKFRSDVEN